jgi:succinylarginine dihydrolase
MSAANATAVEVNFDGLVGPTHAYGGLSHGNVASSRNRGDVSNPRAAALQGLAKMRRLMELGLMQGVLPPHERPDVGFLRRLGFSGGDAMVVEAAAKVAPGLLAAASSASAMWTANAATVSPGADTADGRVHFTPANLAAMLHRSIEAPQTARTLRAIFADPARFAHHPPVPGGARLGDEGAANHGRLAPAHGAPGIELFVYGRAAAEAEAPGDFPARQVREASEAVARLHGLSAERAVFVRQSRAAIDAGAFHNDVVSVTNGTVLLTHEGAFEEGGIAAIRAASPFDIEVISASAAEVPLEDAVKSYLFNSQLVTLPDGAMALILPEEARENPRTAAFLERIAAAGGPVRRLEFLDLRQSMRNGGGPACLRLRVVLTAAERAALAGRCLLDTATLAMLEAWVEKHYRDRLTAADLADPKLLDEGRTALDELTATLGLGSIYPFQGAGGGR